MATRERQPLPIPYDCRARARLGRAPASIMIKEGGSHSRSEGRSVTRAARVAGTGGAGAVSAAGNGPAACDGAAPRDVRAAGGDPGQGPGLGVALPPAGAAADFRAPPRRARGRLDSPVPATSGV